MHQIQLNDQLYEEAQRRATATGFSSVDDFVANILRLELNETDELPPEPTVTVAIESNDGPDKFPLIPETFDALTDDCNPITLSAFDATKFPPILVTFGTV